VNPSSSPPRAESRRWLDDPYLSLRQRISGAPSNGLVKGWLFHSVIDGAKRHGVELGGARRFAFKDYSVADYLDLLGEAAVRVHPQRSPKETLRLLGRGVYPSFANSLVGKVIVTGLGSGHAGARSGLRWVAHVYKLTSNHAVAKVTEQGDHVSIVDLEDVWSFPDSYHAGIFEGAADAFGGRVSVDVASRSLSSATLTLTWQV
jgi:uncharacterized protein (TIGR02265 family)